MDPNMKPKNLAHEENSQVQMFYKDTKVLATGATGFMGKTLIEKLLRCTEIATIYLLVRSKKGKDVYSRVDEIFDDVIFKTLKTEVPKFRHKIVAIAGDCALPDLGLSIEDRCTLIENVNVVFHSAATLNFDEKLRTAYHINVGGTEAMIKLCKEFKKLKAFIHVSTAFSNCYRKKIDEVFYDYSINYRDVEAVVEKLDDESLQKTRSSMLGNWPNTYTFTKALTEAMIKDKASGIPMGVFRPSVIFSTYREPIEGWIDSFYGATGICAGAYTGVIRTLMLDKEKVANVVPVDMCVSALLASAWDVANKKCERIPENIPIYNYVSNNDNPLTWGEYNRVIEMYGDFYPLMNAIWCVTLQLTTNKSLHFIRKLFFHYLPAILLDILGLLIGNRPRYTKLYKKVDKLSHVLTYFSLREWAFTNDNVLKLWNKMNNADRDLFPFNMSDVHWMTYLKRYVVGIRLYLLKDPLETMAVAKIKQKRFIILHKIMKYAIIYLSVNIMCNWTFKMISWCMTTEPIN